VLQVGGRSGAGCWGAGNAVGMGGGDQGEQDKLFLCTLVH
jgi:hypothetical protein